VYSFSYDKKVAIKKDLKDTRKRKTEMNKKNAIMRK